MTTRSVKIPGSIKVAIACFLLGLPMKAFSSWVYVKQQVPTANWLTATGFDLVLVAYQVFALARLSRWAPITRAVAVVGFTAWRYAQDSTWTQRYPMLGVFAVITPSLVYFALVLPHWSKMNWAPLGLPYRARSAPDVEVF